MRLSSSFTLFLLCSAGAFAEEPIVRTGFFAAGEAYLAPQAEAPARESRALVRSVVLEQGRKSVALPLVGGSPLVVFTAAAAPGADGRARPVAVSVALRLPSGDLVGEGDAGLRRVPIETQELGLDVHGASQALHLAAVEPGRHQLELSGEPGAVVTVAAAEPESALVLETQAGPLSRQPGETVTLRATLRDGSVPVRGARVSARLTAEGRTGGKPLVLRDDGRSGDGAAGDGVYGLLLRGLPSQPAGLWSVRVEAQGLDAAGRAFERTGGSGFVNEAGAARLARVSGRLVERDGRRMLHVEASTDVAVAGRYRLDAIVAGAPDAKGEQAGKAWGESSRRLSAGRQRLRLDVPLPATDGTRESLLVDVRLLGLDQPGLAGRTTFEVR